MESQQASQGKPSKGKGKATGKGNDKEKQSRRLWTLKEEEVLLVCMLEEFKDGVKWKAGNGFKSGFFGVVEILFHKMLPGTTIRATPNIESKVKNWKEKYGLLADMQRLSGFSWNHDTNSVIVDSPDVWEDYVKFHPKANGMNGKAFPMYPSWTILFGKDRATGEMAEDPPEIRDDDWEEEIDQVWHEESVVGTNDCYTPRFANGEFVFGGGGSSFIDLSAGGSQPANPTTPTSNGNASTPTSNANANANANSNANANPPPKKAKKLSRGEAKQKAIHDTFGRYMEESKEVMVKLVDNVGYDQKLSDKRIGVFPNLENLELEMEDMLTANAMILASEERVDEFYSVPERYRKHWVTEIDEVAADVAMMWRLMWRPRVAEVAADVAPA
ncbi:hypothetical protein Vadar_008668 [Vaccinium darrowii]|uniref:Uncharacterized protein n=1 Tax=Vaccinium darrowii TaxID=229202 RepID=A0ACB7YCE9_9ERIC|nr:hypothetical protein Vadar_008668 [Vaccinium darrowii]